MHACKSTNPVILWRHIIAQPVTLPAKVSERLAQKKVRWKRYFDKKVRTRAVFTPDQMAYLNQPPLTLITASISISDEYNYLLLNTAKLFKVFGVKDCILAIYKNGVVNIILIRIRTLTGIQHCHSSSIHKTAKLRMRTVPTIRQADFVVDKAAHFRQITEGLQYRVHWFCYGPKMVALVLRWTYQTFLSTIWTVKNNQGDNQLARILHSVWAMTGKTCAKNDKEKQRPELWIFGLIHWAAP